MDRYAIMVILAASAWLMGSAAPSGAAQDVPAQHSATAAAAAPFDGVLLLKNGGVLRGQLSQSDDRWIVRSATSELQVAVKSVDFACRSLDEAYSLQQHRLATAAPASEGQNAEAHLKLADWCLRYDLFTQAAGELSDARRIDPQHPRIAHLETRLAQVREIASRAAERAAARPAAEMQPQKPAPQMTSEVVVPTPTDLIAPLPNGAFEHFVRHVQPVLVNNCTTAGCHQLGGAQQFQLDRALLHGTADRRTAMRNLAATLNLVDRRRPDESPLLVVPRRLHGGMPRPVFGPHQDQLVAQLLDWIKSVATNNEGRAPISSVQAAPADNPIAGPNGSTVDRAVPISAAPVGVVPVGYDYAAAPALATKDRRTGAPASTWQPRDAFDPEIFNRRFAPSSGQPPPRVAD